MVRQRKEESAVVVEMDAGGRSEGSAGLKTTKSTAPVLLTQSMACLNRGFGERFYY